MFILENPYVSGLILETLEKNQYPVLENDFALSYTGKYNLNLIKSETIGQKMCSDRDFKVYSNSENSINFIMQYAKKTNIAEYIRICKNKVLFREKLSGIYPEFFYKEVLLNELETLDINGFPKQFIIKPSIGFLSMGVHKVSSHSDWEKVVKQIKSEIRGFTSHFPKDVLDSSSFIVEEIISGDEYAIDAYYNEDGKPVIVNIFQHPFLNDEDVRDRVYISSSEIIRNNLKQFETILVKIGKAMDIKNFPIHIEMIRRKADGAVIPVEINPMRFAGWCTTDLAYYAYGINIYEYFMNNFEPNWNEILKDKNDKIYYFVMAETPADLNKSSISFNYKGLEQFFTKILEFRKIDYINKPLFAIIFGETTSVKEIEGILKLDIKEFVN